jgi:hypothetical protein
MTGILLLTLALLIPKNARAADAEASCPSDSIYTTEQGCIAKIMIFENPELNGLPILAQDPQAHLLSSRPFENAQTACDLLYPILSNGEIRIEASNFEVMTVHLNQVSRVKYFFVPKAEKLSFPQDEDLTVFKNLKCEVMNSHPL